VGTIPMVDDDDDDDDDDDGSSLVKMWCSIAR